MNTKNTILGALSLLAISLNISVNAKPSGVSLETIKNLDGERFWQSEIQCSNKTGLRYIEKPVDSERWCLQLSPSVCFTSKTLAANKVCSDSYDNAVLATNQLNEAIASTPAISTLPAPTSVLAVNTVNSNNPSSGYIEEDDDDDLYFNVNELITEKAQLESELSKVQLKKIELNRRKTELQNSIPTN